MHHSARLSESSGMMASKGKLICNSSCSLCKCHTTRVHSVIGECNLLRVATVLHWLVSRRQPISGLGLRLNQGSKWTSHRAVSGRQWQCGTMFGSIAARLLSGADKHRREHSAACVAREKPYIFFAESDASGLPLLCHAVHH